MLELIDGIYTGTAAPAGGGGGGGAEYICTNTTGVAITKGDVIYIAANSNLKLIDFSKTNRYSFSGVALEDIAIDATGKVQASMPEPVTGLKQFDRIDDKATVAGFFTDENGTKYAVCVADANYRSRNRWGETTASGSPCVPAYNYDTDAMQSTKSSTQVEDNIIKVYSTDDYHAFRTYNNILTYNNVKYRSNVPTLYELKMVWDNRTTLDALDTHLSEYPNKSLAIWRMSDSTTANQYCWSCMQQSGTGYANRPVYVIYVNGTVSTQTYTNSNGVIPVFEIPVAD